MLSVHSNVRALLRSPGFSFTVIFTMALGIGTATALFSVVDAVLLQPLAFPDADRIVAVETTWPQKDKVSPRMTGGDFLDLRSSLKSFSDLATYHGGELGIHLRGQSLFAETFEVDPKFFSVLRVNAAAGRLPEPEDAERGAVLSVGFAQANWGEPEKALGQTVTVEGKPYDVIGLLDDRFAFPEKAQLWVTGSRTPQNQSRSAFNYYAVARVRPEQSLARAQSELSVEGIRLADLHPDTNQGKSFHAVPLQDQLAAPYRATLWFLLGAAALLLLISCANVANLMLARASGRAGEIAVRRALGAKTSELFWLLFGESLWLGTCAGITGTFLAYLGIRLFFPLIPASLPHAADALHLNAAVLLFSATVSCLTMMICCLIPTLRMRRVELTDALRSGPGRSRTGSSTHGHPLMVVAQIAVCCVLCTGAVMLSRALMDLIQTPLGFRTEGVLVMYASAPAVELPQYLRAVHMFETALDGIRRVPGVKSAAAVMGLPTGRYGSNGSYLVEGIQIQEGQDPMKMSWPHDSPEAIFALVSPQYFSTVGIRLLAGHDFTSRDEYDAPFTAIVSQSLAKQSFGDANPIGKRIYCGLDSPKPMTIVGVVSDVRQDSPASKLEPEIYMPFQQHPYFANELQIAIRTIGNAAHLAPAVRSTVHDIDPYVATRFTTFNEIVQDSIAAPRFRAGLIGAFSMLALMLAMAGIYAVMSYWVSTRTAEMGLRMALGADRIRIVALVSRQALWLSGAGLAVGAALSWVVYEMAKGFVFGVHALDVISLFEGAAAVLLVVMAAALIPSLRAARVDPAVALRNQ